MLVNPVSTKDLHSRDPLEAELRLVGQEKLRASTAIWARKERLTVGLCHWDSLGLVDRLVLLVAAATAIQDFPYDLLTVPVLYREHDDLLNVPYVYAISNAVLLPGQKGDIRPVAQSGSSRISERLPGVDHLPDDDTALVGIEELVVTSLRSGIL